MQCGKVEDPRDDDRIGSWTAVAGNWPLWRWGKGGKRGRESLLPQGVVAGMGRGFLWLWKLGIGDSVGQLCMLCVISQWLMIKLYLRQSWGARAGKRTRWQIWPSLPGNEIMCDHNAEQTGLKGYIRNLFYFLLLSPHCLFKPLCGGMLIAPEWNLGQTWLLLSFSQIKKINKNISSVIIM